jgi:D-serine deaminase-like pyridoxal phosphate-dependent protein
VRPADAAPLPFGDLPIGARVRVLPNHVCMTAAMYDRYHVVDGGTAVVAEWTRINGW